MLNENVASVNHRYREVNDVDAYLFTRYGDRGQIIKPVQVLKAIDCYEYQSCEHPEWEGSEARAFCRSLRHAMIHALPGYDGAQWAID